MNTLHKLKIFIFLIFFCSSCALKKNKEYASDFTSLNSVEYAKKYMTLYNNLKIDFSNVKENKAYVTYRNNDTFKVLVFCKNGFTYYSPYMPIDLLYSKIPAQKLFRGDYFFLKSDTVKFETVDVHINSVIEEGYISNDSITINKKYYSKRKKRIYKIKINYVLNNNIKVYKFDDDRFIIELKP